MNIISKDEDIRKNLLEGIQLIDKKQERKISEHEIRLIIQDELNAYFENIGVFKSLLGR